MTKQDDEEAHINYVQIHATNLTVYFSPRNININPLLPAECHMKDSS